MNLGNDIVAIIFLTTCTAFIYKSSQSNSQLFKTVYKWIPAILWLYIVPALANTLNWVTASEGIKDVTSNWVLPFSIIILTASIDIKSLFTITKKAVIVFFLGTIGIVLGGPLALAIVGAFDSSLLNDLGEHTAWRGLVCITGSWINGSAGQLSMREAFGCSEELFFTVATTDIILQNGWLVILLYSSRFQTQLNKWLTKSISQEYGGETLKVETEPSTDQKNKPPDLLSIFIILGALGGIQFLADSTTQFGVELIGNNPTDSFSFLTKKSFWLIILASLIGLILSFTPLLKKHSTTWSWAGNLTILYVIASIGLQFDLAVFNFRFSFFMIGILWLLIHLTFMLIGAKLIKAPWHYSAIGSQANIGGPASSSIIAATFHPSLVPLAILLSVLSNLIGNYAGIIAGILFQWII